MQLTHEDVAAILELIDRSDIEYLEVEVGGTRLLADRSGATAAARATGPARAGVPAPSTPAYAAAPAPPAPAPAVAAPSVAAADVVTVDAPLVGVFYRSPEPGAAPFVEVGSRVEEGATMGLVEVMKMFNSVTAPVAGEVVEVLVGNDEFVEFGQPLFTVRRAAA